MLTSTATDNVDTDVSVDCIPSSEEVFLVGDTTVNCNSTDTAGNTGNCSLIVTVIGTKSLFSKRGPSMSLLVSAWLFFF